MLLTPTFALTAVILAFLAFIIMGSMGRGGF
jgi:hypothetical protein